MELVEEKAVKKQAPNQANQKKLEELTKSGIKVSKAVFHSSVDGAKQNPNDHYSVLSNNAERRAEMWLTDHFFILKQGDFYFGTGLANIKFIHFEK